MQKNIILAGVGGQGILTIATIIGYAALKDDLRLKQAEVHGMSQRGGDVQSHLRYSDKEIFSDLIPEGKADLVLSVEPMEALRYLPYLSEEGWLITNTKPFVNIPNYPDKEKIYDEIKKLPHKVMIDADKIARELNSVRSMNIVMLGAAAEFLGLEYKHLEEGIKFKFQHKSDKIIETNIKALKQGFEFTQANK